jgi:hypothetical protein
MVSDVQYAGHSESAFRMACLERRYFSSNIDFFMIAIHINSESAFIKSSLINPLSLSPWRLRRTLFSDRPQPALPTLASGLAGANPPEERDQR